jgi:hypothetical protein
MQHAMTIRAYSDELVWACCIALRIHLRQRAGMMTLDKLLPDFTILRLKVELTYRACERM